MTTRRSLLGLSGLMLPVLALACGSTPAAHTTSSNLDDSSADSAPMEPVDAGDTDIDANVIAKVDASTDDAVTEDAAAKVDAPPATTAIQHVVIIVQENHTFDTYFGTYCGAAPGSNPTCTTGSDCCEAAPATDPSGASPTILDDTENAAYDPNHTQPCEASEMDDGAMDHYTTGASCSDPRNFALAGPDTVGTYHDYARSYAIADRYFQPLVGQSSANDMYLAVAQHVFTDNAYEPDSNGHGCSIVRSTITYTGQTTIADVLINAGHSFAYYAQGYTAMKNALLCPLPPSDCPAHIPTAPCDYDPGDVPFEYYSQFTDNPDYMKDYDDLASDLSGGSLPDVTFVKGLQYHNEHPGYGTKISDGVKFISQTVDAITNSEYGPSTLILITWDEGGGFFDHVAPPGVSPADNQPYGTRVPLIAIGPFVKKNHVSHVTMEHSSIVKFLEYNFTGQTGQLAARDAVVNNIGSVLDPSTTGITIPEN